VGAKEEVKFQEYCTRQGTDGKRPDISIVGLIHGGEGHNAASIPWLLHLINYMSFFKDVATVIQVWKNLGVIAKNLGYSIAMGDLVFSIDSDVVARPEAIDKCVDYMNAHPEAWLIGPCGGRLDPDRWTTENWPVRPDYVGTCFGFDDWLDYNQANPNAVDGIKVDVIPSMFWCFRRSVLEKVGYLNWRYGPFVGSDSDFCFRIKEAGGEIHIVRGPISHIDGGGKSHKGTGKELLNSIRKDHVKWLHDDWFSKKEKVLHKFMGR
jgi:GT2 family glycosyltransferase